MQSGPKNQSEFDMTAIVVGNSGSYGSATANAADFAAGWGSERASASSGALTIKKGVTISNANTSNPRFYFSDGTDQGMTSGENITSDTEGPVEINSGGVFGTTVTIGSGIYLWSDDNTKAALIINVPCTVTNSGKIMGKGGDGGGWENINGTGSFLSPQNGGPAIEINSSGVSITNNTNAWIGGGGGGGGNIGGGGAGGGKGGNGRYLAPGPTNQPGGAGGSIGNIGGTGAAGKDGYPVAGGGAGGGGAHTTSWYGGGQSGGGGGGRIFPGTGGAGGVNGWGPPTGQNGGAGGAGGNAGGYGFGGGGGGWGAAGGRSGGSGGAAIDDNGYTYTLSNSGTIYGST